MPLPIRCSAASRGRWIIPSSPRRFLRAGDRHGRAYGEAAVKQGFALDIYKSTFRPLKATLSGRQTRTLMKLVVDQATQKVLGVHVVGPDAGEMIQLAAVAVGLGATKADFDRTVAVHPTAAEEW